ncbi:MAG: hypothetical protein HFK04_04240 [Oscillospiraceae bacterium]|nr:hypothetical protein [Oscillospiraceae bacterium]
MKRTADSTEPIRKVRVWKSKIGKVPGGITRGYLPELTPEEREKRMMEIARAGMPLILMAEARAKAKKAEAEKLEEGT